ncbi:MAG: hypothetical protein Q9171_000491 [Xanthocarpia ochracea]
MSRRYSKPSSLRSGANLLKNTGVTKKKQQKEFMDAFTTLYLRPKDTIRSQLREESQLRALYANAQLASRSHGTSDDDAALESPDADIDAENPEWWKLQKAMNEELHQVEDYMNCCAEFDLAPEHPRLPGDSTKAQNWDCTIFTARGTGFSTEYLVPWKGYGPEFDQWYNVKDLENARGLVDEYEQQMTAAYEAMNRPPAAIDADQDDNIDAIQDDQEAAEVPQIGLDD